MTDPTRVLVVDDYEPWRKYLRSVLTRQPGFEVLGEVSDGLKAVRKAEELQPDLILLDLSLPSIHGIDAARLMRRVAPCSKILFLSENRHPEVAEAALSAGGHGFVVKSDCGHELIVAITAVLREETFISQRLQVAPAFGRDLTRLDFHSPLSDAICATILDSHPYLVISPRLDDSHGDVRGDRCWFQCGMVARGCGRWRETKQIRQNGEKWQCCGAISGVTYKVRAIRISPGWGVPDEHERNEANRLEREWKKERKRF